jgi:hypothetical protein
LLVEMLNLRAQDRSDEGDSPIFAEAKIGTVPQEAAAELGRAILARADTAELERLAVLAGMTSRWRRAVEAAGAGLTSPAEIRRLLGLAAAPPHEL